MTWWESILAENPQDLLALFFAHHTYTLLADSKERLASIVRVLPMWDGGVNGFGTLLGLHAYALAEENWLVSHTIKKNST